jgi:hypothetical protein
MRGGSCSRGAMRAARPRLRASRRSSPSPRPCAASPWTDLSTVSRSGEPRALRGEAPVPDLLEAFSEALPRIVDAYRDAFDRAPRPSELARSLEFVVAADPQTYFGDVADDPQVRIGIRDLPDPAADAAETRP